MWGQPGLQVKTRAMDGISHRMLAWQNSQKSYPREKRKSGYEFEVTLGYTERLEKKKETEKRKNKRKKVNKTY